MSSEEYHTALLPLSWLFGRWESISAVVSYPTMDTLNYEEIMEFQPTCEPYIRYKSETWHAVTKNKLHSEMGYLRVDPEVGTVALILAHHFGATEISEGTVDKETLHFESKSVSEPSFAKTPAVRKIVRDWTLNQGELASIVHMETVNTPLQKHLESRYKKK